MISKIAFIFPGQGSQAPGMGVALADHYPAAKVFFEQASVLFGRDLLELCRSGSEDELRQTQNAQPALYVTGVAAAAVLRAEGLQPTGVAGHSVGEYAALADAGVFSFEEGFRFVQARGELMQDAATKEPGTMAAILGMDRTALTALCAEVQASLGGVCVPVNFNTPEQTVVAGNRQTVEALVKVAPEKGAKRAILLNVSGAFHTPLMNDAAQAMSQILAKVPFRSAQVSVAMNSDGQLHLKGAEIRENLKRQLVSPVEWLACIRALAEIGITRFVECGSGKVLSGLLRRIDKSLQAYSTDTADALAQTRDELLKTTSA